MPELGLIIPPDQPPERFVELARAAERAGLDEVWVWEDCFAQSGLATASVLLASTERIRVGIGLLPVPLRNVALTAMEVATLARLFPGRLVPGIGHGVLDWMGQAGVRAASPTTLLTEYTTALGALLAGEEVTTHGRYVQLDRVRLRWPPEASPPLLLGARGPRTLALAGALGDGVVLDEYEPGTVAAAADAVQRTRREQGRPGQAAVVVFVPVPLASTADSLTATVQHLATAGAHRVAVFAAGDDGAPWAGHGVAELAAELGRCRGRLG